MESNLRPYPKDLITGFYDWIARGLEDSIQESPSLIAIIFLLPIHSLFLLCGISFILQGPGEVVNCSVSAP